MPHEILGARLMYVLWFIVVAYIYQAVAHVFLDAFYIRRAENDRPMITWQKCQFSIGDSLALLFRKFRRASFFRLILSWW